MNTQEIVVNISTWCVDIIIGSQPVGSYRGAPFIFSHFAIYAISEQLRQDFVQETKIARGNRNHYNTILQAYQAKVVNTP